MKPLRSEKILSPHPALNAPWLHRLERLDRLAVLFTALLTIVGVGSIDVLVEKAVHYNFMVGSVFFYLVPIAFVAWTCGTSYARAVTISASITDSFTTLTMAEHRHPVHLLVIEMLLEFTLFSLVAIILIALRKAFDYERSMSRTDPLTSLYNVRGFSEAADQELERMRRYKSPLTVAYLDVDDFKTINDKGGHKHGDDVLAAIGDVLLSVSRAVDTAGRLGGDEFAVLLPETKVEDAAKFVERLRVELTRVLGNEVTFSAGLVTFDTAPQSVDTLLQPADAMMYAAKKSGKNRVVTLPAGPTHAQA
jgi:diguanylate cyclase (GGDEF)-like protein